MNQQYDSESLLYKNVFISPEDLEDLTPQEQEKFIAEYTKYLSSNPNKKTNQKVSIPKKIETYQRSVIVIDSKYRNTKIYDNPNDFIYNFPRKYTNIASIKLIGSIIPNTDSVIKQNPESSRNNKVYWINQEDVDLEFPIYSISLRPGNYTATSIVSELISQMNSVKRRNGSGPNHSFNISIDLDTEICTFTSLDQTNLSTDAFTATVGSSVIIVTQIAHGYITGDVITFSGVQAFAGFQAVILNNSYAIQVLDNDSYSFSVNVVATQSTSGGGNAIFAGKSLPFKFLWGDYNDSVQFNLGFEKENSSAIIPTNNPISTYAFNVLNVIPGSFTQITAIDHGLSVGNQIIIRNLFTLPTIEKQIVTVSEVLDDDNFLIDFDTSYVDTTNIDSVFVSTNIVNLNFPNHGFNKIISITNGGIDTIQCITQLTHSYQTGDFIWITEGNSIPPVNLYTSITVINPITFSFSTLNLNPNPFVAGIISPGTSGFIGITDKFSLYNIRSYQDGTIGGISPDDYINGQILKINKIIDSNNFNFIVPGAFSTSIQTGGDQEVRISSYLHGFNGTQKNQNSSTEITRPISLSGVDYIYLCSPQLEGTIENNSGIKDAFAIIQLSQPPNSIIFNSFIDNPKIYYDSPLPVLEKLQFIVRNPDGTLFDFNKIDYSITLEIIEVVDKFRSINISSQRGTSYNYEGLQNYLGQLKNT